MRDTEIEAPLAERRADGLAPVYDRYAPALHAYCRSLLGEPADADDAVQDTFIIAAAELDGLPDPGRLRPWLYAVARNECRDRLRSRALAARPDAAEELTDETVDLAADAERAQLRAATAAALAGLGPRDREIIELNLRHQLEGQDLADVLGVSVSQAEALVSRARARFEASLGALLIARTGQESCPELTAMLSRWDGQLNVLLRKRVNRHIEHCDNCDDRRRHELNPAMLLSMLPVALPPPGLRDQLFRLIDDMGPAASAYRAGVVHRAGPFGWSGFPEPLDPPYADYRRKAQAVAAGVAALALFAAGAVFGAGVLNSHGRNPASAAGATPFGAAPAQSVMPEVTERSKPHARTSPPVFGSPNLPWISAIAPTSLIARSRPPAGSGSSSGSGSSPGSGSSSGSGSGSPSSPPATPTPTPSPTPPVSPTPTPSDTPTPTPSDSSSPTGSSSPTDSSSPSAPATLVPSSGLVSLPLAVLAAAH
jgi:RNA polymerase sigma factor (sigma-70 family)